MSHVVLLRGVNVGGHRTFRPTILVKQLAHLDAVNIGAAGTLVIRKPVGQARLRAELAERLPFATEIMICRGDEIAGLVSEDRFARFPAGGDVVRFVSVLSKRPRSAPSLPLRLPSSGPWLVEIVAIHGRLALGRYRRHMKTIGYLGKLDQLLGVRVTTRNWNTIESIAKVLGEGQPRKEKA